LQFLDWISVKTDLIDRIYECAFVPDLWPAVLDELAELTDSRGGLLFSARDRVLKWTASDNLNDTAAISRTAGSRSVRAGSACSDGRCRGFL